uniref:Transmembrane protein 132C n=1 Tax=Electrophorus electricus TaxID=8005 RepID=A0A4W4FBH1_ELEEL
DSPQRYPSSAYLPVSFQLLHADSSFFLKEATQEFMRNSSLLSRTEAFFIHQARQPPALSATYGRLRAEQPVPLDLLQTPGSYVASSTLFTFNWKLQTFVLGERLYLDRPTVRVLFYVGGRDWDDYSAVDKLPCVQMFAFHETQEVRGSCRLRGELGVCVAELEPPHSWFAAPSVVPGRQRGTDASEGTSVELYYSLRSAEAGDCPGEDAGTRNSARLGHEGAFGSAMSTPMRRIGSVRLFRTLAVPELSEHRLDGNFAVLVTPTQLPATLSLSLSLSLSRSLSLSLALSLSLTLSLALSQLSCFTHFLSLPRLLRGFFFLDGQTADGSNTRAKIKGGSSVKARVGSVYAWRSNRCVALTPASFSLPQDTEILNTAVLNGRTVAVPVKVVTVTTDGAITDVSDMVQCRSTDEDVVKVSDRCDYVYVNGKEMRGHVHMLVNFTYSYVTAQLELQVWIPRLPLQIDVSDTELSQIKGWRVPAAPNAQRRSARDHDEDEDDEERRGRSCTLQYQRATVRVLTHFVAESADVRGQLTYMLGSDWQLDITGLVWDFLKVENTRIARLQEGRLIEGLDTGMTSVLSPLSDSILAEKSVRVLEERVSVTELGLQLVSGLTLTLQLSTGSNRAVSATATTQEVLDTPKQEALISAWLQFSDGSMAPLDQYSSEHFVLTALSLDEAVVSVRQDVAGRWPVVSAEAEGRGLLVRVEMSVCEACQKFKRRSVLAAGNCNVLVKFGRGEGDGAMRRITTTTKTTILRRPGGNKLSDAGRQVPNVPVDFSDFPAQVDLPRGRNVYEDDLVQSPRSLSDLEIGMYALLGVFCLAILVFLINCISYTLKYRHKELSVEGQESMNHAHDWVWLGNEAELLESHVSLSPQTEERLTIMDSSIGGLEEGSQLLNGGSSQKNAQGHLHRRAESAAVCTGKDGKGESPTTKRKRVKFTTFTTIPVESVCAASDALGEGPNQDIKWVCQDVELGDSKDLQNYMERLSDVA